VRRKDNDGKTEFLAEIDQTSHVLINGHGGTLTSQSYFTFPNPFVRDKCESACISRVHISITKVRWHCEKFIRSIGQSINQTKDQSLSAETFQFPSPIRTNISSPNCRLAQT
jgi:hypothetical protein